MEGVGSVVELGMVRDVVYAEGAFSDAVYVWPGDGIVDWVSGIDGCTMVRMVLLRAGEDLR